jgi:hypothetical protein
MTIIEYRTTSANILDCVEDGIRNLKDTGEEPRFICCGSDIYGDFCKAISERFKRDLQNYETYSFIPIIVDPFRSGTLCVLPAPRAVNDGIEPIRM